MSRVVFVFLDGVGLGDDDAGTNVFVAHPPPILCGLLGGARIVRGAPLRTAEASLIGLDASLGVDGTPQSGTGQTALFTGRNAAVEFGRHFGPWVPAAMRATLRDESILARAKRAGLNVAFANAYPEEVLRDAAGLPGDGAPGRARRANRFLNAGPPQAALGAGVLVRHTDALERGNAIASELTNETWRRHLGKKGLPVITAREAGVNLGRIAGAHDLTLFAHYGTDYAGHTKSMEKADRAIRRVDAFLGGLIETLPPDAVLIVSSDHGNIEDMSTGHTRNPAIGLIVGRGHAELSEGWGSILDVARGIMGWLGVTAGEGEVEGEGGEAGG